jgi:hypothetical protein
MTEQRDQLEKKYSEYVEIPNSHIIVQLEQYKNVTQDREYQPKIKIRFRDDPTGNLNDGMRPVKDKDTALNIGKAIEKLSHKWLEHLSKTPAQVEA